mgnify:CR=1 FL=1
MNYILQRKLKNAFMLALVSFCAGVAVFPLISVFVYLFQKGVSALNWDFFTQLPAPVGSTGGGIGNGLLGSALLIGMASLVGIPWGVGVGIYLAEPGQKKYKAVLRFITELLISTPSIVIGLFAYTIFVMPMKRFSAHAGAASLVLILVPTLARTTEGMLRQIPSHIREAGLALGLPRWKVTLFVLVRAGMGGILTGIMLGIARIAGETAPLLFTALNNQFWPRALDQPISSLPVQIYTYAISPFEEWQRMAYGGAFVLMVLVLSLNLFTRFFLKRKFSSAPGTA